MTFVSPAENAIEKKKENNGNCKAFCIARKRNKTFIALKFMFFNFNITKR